MEAGGELLLEGEHETFNLFLAWLIIIKGR